MKKPSTTYSDEELYLHMNRKKAEAAKAFTELYNRYSVRVYAYCMRILGNRDEANDAFQETFIRFYNSAGSDRDIQNVPGYLFRIARNLCLNAVRDRKNHLTVEDYHLAIRDIPYEKTEFLQMIASALELLPLEFREPFVLREYDAFSYADISHVTGVPVSLVKIRIHRAKDKIRKILAPYLAEVSDL